MANSSSSKQVEELLTQAAVAVKAKEPGTLRYHLQKETKGDAPTFIMLETCALTCTGKGRTSTDRKQIQGQGIHRRPWQQ
jgi:hypothetical protein